MKRSTAMRVLCLVLALLVGLGALGGGIYAMFSGGQQQDAGAPLFMYQNQLYLVTNESLQAIEGESQPVTVETRVEEGVVPRENGASNFCPVGTRLIYTESGDLYYPYEGSYLLCVPVETRAAESSGE